MHSIHSIATTLSKRPSSLLGWSHSLLAWSLLCNNCPLKIHLPYNSQGVLLENIKIMSLTWLKFSSDLISFKCQTYKIYKIPTIAWTAVYLLLQTSILSLLLCSSSVKLHSLPGTCQSLSLLRSLQLLFSLWSNLFSTPAGWLLPSGVSSNIFKRSSSQIVVLNPYHISKLPRKLIKTSADGVPLLLLLLLGRFSHVRLCDPIDGSPPGSPVPGILQARTLE